VMAFKLKDDGEELRLLVGPIRLPRWLHRWLFPSLDDRASVTGKASETRDYLGGAVEIVGEVDDGKPTPREGR
jgi:hypothetical protein